MIIWKNVVASEYCSNITDGTHDSPKRTDKGHYLVTSKHIKGHDIDFSNAYLISDEDYKKIIQRSKVDQWDIIISMIGAYCGYCYVERNSHIDYTIKNVGLLKTGSEEKAWWLYYYLNSPSGRSMLSNMRAGSTQPYISLTELRKMIIPVPDDISRTKIIRVLRAIDVKIETNEKINENLSQQLRLIFQHTFLDEEHPEWPVEKLGSFLSLERGLSYKGKFLSDSEGVPMVNLGNILPNSVFRSEKLKFYTGDYKAKVIVKPGDIVVANTDLTQAREVLGSAILIPDLGYPTIICSHHISIVRDCRISKHFIHGMLNSPSYRERVVGFATGTTVLALPSETILNCEFALPPNELIVEYDSIAESYYQKSEQLRKENQQLTQLRDTLIPQLMFGQLDVSEV